MAYGFDFLPFMQAIGLFTGIAVILFMLNVKRDFSWTWMWLVILPVYLVLLQIPKGTFGDIFFNTPWTLEVAVIASIVTFMALGFKFPVKNESIILIVGTFIVLQLLHLTLWANLIGIVFYALFSYLFINTGIQTLKHWFSDNP